METQNFKNNWGRLSKEQRERVTPEFVENLMEPFVTPEQWPAFKQRNKAEFSKIAKGYVSKVMTFYSKQNNRPYKARIKGLLASKSSDDRITVDFIFAQRELVIPNQLSVRGGTDIITLTDDQITKLTRWGFLDELLSTEKGGQFFAEVDRELNRLAIADAQYVRVPKKLHGTTLTDTQIKTLKSGRSMEYERANPNDKTETLVLSAMYSPVFYSIRSVQVLDEKGKAVTRKVEVVKTEATQTLQAVEQQIAVAGQKESQRVAQKQQR